MLAGMAHLAGGSDRARLPTIVDVASRAGVSIATVSRVVTGTGRVKEATRARVEHAIAATGWTRDNLLVERRLQRPPRADASCALVILDRPLILRRLASAYS